MTVIAEGITIEAETVAATWARYQDAGFEPFRQMVQTTLRDSDPGFQALDYEWHRSPRTRAEQDQERLGFLLGYAVLHEALGSRSLAPNINAYVARNASSFDMVKMHELAFQQTMCAVVAADYVASSAIDDWFNRLHGHEYGPLRWGLRVALGLNGQLANPASPGLRLPVQPAVQRTSRQLRQVSQSSTRRFGAR